MNTWNQSINPAVEGVRFDQLKERLKSKFGLNDKVNIETLSKNMKTIVTVSQMRTLNNSVINDYCDELDKANQTSATVAEMAKAYLIDKAYKNKQVYMLSVMAGVDYSNIAPKTNRYTTLMSKVTISEEATVSNQRDAERRLKDLSTLIDLGTEALSAVTDIYAQTKNLSKTNLNCQINYETILKKHGTLMHDGAQVTQESTNDGPKLLLEDMVKTTLIKHDPALLNKTKQLIPPANKLLAQSKLVDKTSDVIWKEWEQVNKTQVEIANLYSKLSEQTNNSIVGTTEGRTPMSNWSNSLEPAVEAGGFAKIKDKVSKVFGIGDQKRVDNLRASTQKKIATDSLLTVKDKVVSSAFYYYLKKQNQTTTTVGELSAFCLSAELLRNQRNLQQSTMVASGQPQLPQFQKLPALLKQIDIFVDNYTEDTVVDNIKKMNGLIDKIGSVYDSINAAAEYTKPATAADIKKEVTYKQILDHHQNSVQVYWEAEPDTPFKIRDIAKKLKKQNGGNPAHVAGLNDVLSRFDDLKEKLNTTASYSWTMALEWMLVTNMEIKMANIYDDLRKEKVNTGTESSGWCLALGIESDVPEEENEDMGEVSDGAHTFNELYYHRTTLFNIILCQNKDKAWKSKLHDDGTMFDDYFIAGIETPEGNFTYHQHMDFWDKFDVVEREKAPVWDGHKSSDITRLYSLL